MTEIQRNWLETLPEPFNDNPIVVVVLVPDEAHLRIAQRIDGSMTFGLAEMPDGTLMGLHVLNPPIGNYLEHVMAFRESGKKMLPPDYLGPLHDVPHELLNRDDVCPLVFLHDEPHHSFLNLKRYFTKDDPTWN